MTTDRMVRALTTLGPRISEAEQKYLEQAIKVIGDKYGLGKGALVTPEELRTFPKRPARWVAVTGEAYSAISLDVMHAAEDFQAQMRDLLLEPWLRDEPWISRFVTITHSRIREQWDEVHFVITGPTRRLVVGPISGLQFDWDFWFDDVELLATVEPLPGVKRERQTSRPRRRMREEYSDEDDD